MTGVATAIDRKDNDFRAFAFDEAFFRSVCDSKKIKAGKFLREEGLATLIPYWGRTNKKSAFTGAL